MPLEQVELVALVVALVARELLLARLGLLVAALVSSEAALRGEGLKVGRLTTNCSFPKMLSLNMHILPSSITCTHCT